MHNTTSIILLSSALLSGVAAPVQAALPVFGYSIVHTYPHDPAAFTQGLLYRDGFLYESTGLNGRSSIRKVKLETGKVLQQKALPPEYFGEGLTDWNDALVGITWQTQTGFVFDLASFELRSKFTYPGEGWGLAQDGKQIILSDGSAILRRLDPVTLKEVGRVNVTADGIPLTQINELEWVGNELFANLWQTNTIARIDPVSGKVTGWIDLAGLLKSQGVDEGSADVLNGIAYDAKTKRLFVTGKLWPKLFEIKLVPRPAVAKR